MRGKLKICLGCLREISLSDAVCPYCGFDPVAVDNPRYLRAGIKLKNRYIVGKHLGEGGFGITYMGYDSLKKHPVAIKEYFPSAYASRDMSSGRDANVKVFDGKGGERYLAGIKRFENEGKALAKTEYYAHIVNVKDYFEENNTGYIIMEYIPGTTIYNWVQDNGPMSASNAIGLLLPLIKDLQKIHNKGILHRDISPDNIIIRPDGVAKLIDFGSARKISIEKQIQDKSFTVLVRQQYAPKEQYLRHGNQGRWTDVYSMAATMFFLITGKNPPPVLDRDIDSVRAKFENHLSEMQEGVGDVLSTAMQIDVDKRYKDLSEFIVALESLEIIEDSQKIYERTLSFDREKDGKKVTPLRVKRRNIRLVAVLALIVILGRVIIRFIPKEKNELPVKVETTAEPTAKQVETEKPVATKKPKATAKPTTKPVATKKPKATRKPKVKSRPRVTKKPSSKSRNNGIQIIT